MIDVNEKLNDHWGIVRNYEGIVACLRKSGEKDLNLYIDIFSKMTIKYKLEESEMNMISFLKEQTE